MKNNKNYEDNVITLSMVYSETCFFICHTLNLFQYFANSILGFVSF